MVKDYFGCWIWNLLERFIAFAKDGCNNCDTLKSPQ
jgi:hypothetical protein